MLTLLVCAATGLPGSALAQSAPHPWQTPPPRLVKQAHFTNLRDGASIETPFVLKFGLTGMGLAAITSAQDRTGHHHLLINRELPLDFTKALPFNEQYVHFGKGQMETTLTLKPGKYSLRLVLADHRHVPNFVYSKPAQITVTKFNADVKPETLNRPGVALMLPQTEVAPGQPLQILFHASRLNISHVALKEPGTGHFRLTVTDDSGRTELMDFAGGETETWLAPPRGRYTLKLDLIDNLDPSKVLHSSASVRVSMGP